jgi:hypothetical protein
MFADPRHSNTAANANTAIAIWSTSAVRGSRHTAAPKASTAVIAAVTAIWPVPKVVAAAAR